MPPENSNGLQYVRKQLRMHPVTQPRAVQPSAVKWFEAVSARLAVPRIRRMWPQDAAVDAKAARRVAKALAYPHI